MNYNAVDTRAKPLYKLRWNVAVSRGTIVLCFVIDPRCRTQERRDGQRKSHCGQIRCFQATLPARRN